MVIEILEDDAGPPNFVRFAGLPPLVPPPFVNVSVPRTVPSGESSHALASRLGRRIIHWSDEDVLIAP